MKIQSRKAEYFRALHRGEKLLILPNAWDVPSARIFEDQGFPAVATSSAGMITSLGYPDGESIGRREFLAAVGRISGALTIPLSVDLVSGFAGNRRELSATIRAILQTGAIGINIEDFTHGTGKLIPLDRQLEKIETVRRTGELMGIPIVVNARTDALRFAEGYQEAKMREAIRRCVAFRDAGADCVYPMGLTDADSIGRFVGELKFPVNVMVRPGLPNVRELERLGVARLSFGPSATYAALGLLKRASSEVREDGTYTNLTEGAITFDELNRLAVKRKTAADR